MILSPETTRPTTCLDLPGLIVGAWWVYRLHQEPAEFTAPCPHCGQGITWICWWFEGVPNAGGTKNDNVTVTEAGPCACDDVQVRQGEVAA